MIQSPRIPGNPAELLTRGDVVQEILNIWEKELDNAWMRPVGPNRKVELENMRTAAEVLRQTYVVNELFDLEALYAC